MVAMAKLMSVLSVLRMGHSVLLLDADVTVLQDPLAAVRAGVCACLSKGSGWGLCVPDVLLSSTRSQERLWLRTPYHEYTQTFRTRAHTGAGLPQQGSASGSDGSCKASETKTSAEPDVIFQSGGIEASYVLSHRSYHFTVHTRRCLEHHSMR